MRFVAHGVRNTGTDEGDGVDLWQAIHREATGAWRSVRYDMDVRRAARRGDRRATRRDDPFADRPTYGNGPAADRSGFPARSRIVPLAGVGVLLVGGAAGAFLAIAGGLAALGEDGIPVADRPAAANGLSPAIPRKSADETSRPRTPRRPGIAATSVPSAVALGGPAGTPRTEASRTAPISTPASAEPSATRPMPPSASASESPSDCPTLSPRSSTSSQGNAFTTPGTGR